MLCSVVKHLGSGRALKKWGKTLDCVLCFPLHFFRAPPLPVCFRTEQSTVEASLFVKWRLKIYILYELSKNNPYSSSFAPSAVLAPDSGESQNKKNTNDTLIHEVPFLGLPRKAPLPTQVFLGPDYMSRAGFSLPGSRHVC